MLPGQVVGVGCAVRPGALLVLRFPRIQSPSRQRHCGRGAEAGGRVAQEPDGHRFVQVSLRTQVSVLCLEIRFCNVRPSGPKGSSVINTFASTWSIFKENPSS